MKVRMNTTRILQGASLVQQSALFCAFGQKRDVKIALNDFLFPTENVIESLVTRSIICFR